MLVLIRGAGDLASGVAVRLRRAGFAVAMTELARPTAIRRTVSFCEAVPHGSAMVENIAARRVSDAAEAYDVCARGQIAVWVDESGEAARALKPDALVDAILAKRNVGTRITDAPIVIGLGPGFTAGSDCHAVVETMRGHDLGRVYYTGCALPNTGVPGVIGGYAEERILRAPCDGLWRTALAIGARVQAGDTIATVDGQPVRSRLDGVLRGLLADRTPVRAGMKSGDIDPRGVPEYCATVSDKARAIGGGVLEAILSLRGGAEHV